MKDMRKYACPQCPASERILTSYRGLCRSCTTYSDDNEVVDPVHRVKCDEFGNPVKTIAREIGGPRRGYRQPKKLSKKQRAQIAEEVEIPVIAETLAGGEEE
jgi:hypothetical protein